MLFLTSVCVHAGSFSAPVHEQSVVHIDLEQFIVPHPTRTCMVTVEGTSMERLGIMHGDIVLFERGVSPQSGQCVVVEKRGSLILRQFLKERGTQLLRSTSSEVADLFMDEEISCLGVVKAVIRRYL